MTMREQETRATGGLDLHPDQQGPLAHLSGFAQPRRVEQYPHLWQEI